jgi:hypothetical protein
MTVVLNQHEIWAVVRFGRLLMIPAAVVIGQWLPAHWTVRALVLAFVVGVITNFGFAAYTTQYYFVRSD